MLLVSGINSTISFSFCTVKNLLMLYSTEYRFSGTVIGACQFYDSVMFNGHVKHGNCKIRGNTLLAVEKCNFHIVVRRSDVK